MRAALGAAGGHRGRAASALGVTRQGLTKLVDRLHLDPGADRHGSSVLTDAVLHLPSSAAHVPVLFGVATLVFSLIHLVPGDPAQAMLGDRASPEDIAQLRTRLGLDRPLLDAVLALPEGLGAGNLGTSLRTKQPVTTQIAERLPATAELASAAMLVAVAIAMPLGIDRGGVAGTWVDQAAMGLALLGISVPGLLARTAAGVDLRRGARLAAGVGPRHAGASGAAGDHARARRWRRFSRG